MKSAIDTRELGRSVRGPVLRPGEEGYELESAGYNLAILHQPDIVVGATDARDVVAAMKWAAQHEVPVAVQATGHGAEEAMEGGLLITTGRMQEISVDPAGRTATVEAGVKWRSVLDRIVPHGLMALNGSSSDAGVVGYTLGGGLPVMGRVFGFAADRVLSIDIVTADGRLRTVDARQEPELFGLLRGGKGNLGIVTSMTFELMALDDFYAGGIFYPGDAARDVLTAFSTWAPTLPATAATSVALLRLPDLDIVPEPLRNQFLVHLRFGHAGDAETGARLLAPMREASPPMMDMVAPMSYSDVDQIHMDPPVPVPYRHAGGYLRTFDADTIDALLGEAGPGSSCPLLEVEIRLMGGAYSRVPEVQDAVNGREDPFILVLVGMMVPPLLEAVPASIAAILNAMAPHASGRTLVNLHGVPGDEADRARAWPEDAYRRLVEAKAVYDPNNLMRFQHVIGQDGGAGPSPAGRH